MIAAYGLIAAMAAHRHHMTCRSIAEVSSTRSEEEVKEETEGRDVTLRKHTLPKLYGARV